MQDIQVQLVGPPVADRHVSCCGVPLPLRVTDDRAFGSCLLFVAFPGLQNKMVMGFPSQYIVPIVFGWLVLMVVVAFQAKLTNDLDDEIEELNAGLSETVE